MLTRDGDGEWSSWLRFWCRDGRETPRGEVAAVATSATVLMETFPSEWPEDDSGVSGIVVVRRGGWAPCYYSDRNNQGVVC